MKTLKISLYGLINLISQMKMSVFVQEPKTALSDGDVNSVQLDQLQVIWADSGKDITADGSQRQPQQAASKMLV